MSKKQVDRTNTLLPLGVPRYIRIYENDKTADCYTVVYTGHYRKGKGHDRDWFQYVCMNAAPFHPCGICQHGETEFEPVDRPTYAHLGRKIKWTDLPVDCQKVVLDDYCDLWGIEYNVNQTKLFV